MTTKTPKKHKQRFEHVVITCDSPAECEGDISVFQTKGWELVAVTEVGLKNPNYWRFTLFFKRPV